MNALKALVDFIVNPPQRMSPQYARQLGTYKFASAVVRTYRKDLSQGKPVDTAELHVFLIRQAREAKRINGDLVPDLTQKEKEFLGEEIVASYESHKKDMGFCDE